MMSYTVMQGSCVLTMFLDQNMLLRWCSIGIDGGNDGGRPAATTSVFMLYICIYLGSTQECTD